MFRHQAEKAAMSEKATGTVHVENGTFSLHDAAPVSCEKGKADEATAAETADRILKVDDDRADELRRELETSKQGGWVPATDEEKKFNSRLNLKLDLMVLPYLLQSFYDARLLTGARADLTAPCTRVHV